MPKQVKVEGKIITVPDDATPDEIDQISGGSQDQGRTLKDFVTSPHGYIREGLNRAYEGAKNAYNTPGANAKFKGASEVVRGLGTAAIPVAIPFAVANPLTTVARVAIGTGAQYLGEKGASALGAPEGVSSLAGDLLGARAASFKSPETNFRLSDLTKIKAPTPSTVGHAGAAVVMPFGSYHKTMAARGVADMFSPVREAVANRKTLALDSQLRGFSPMKSFEKGGNEPLPPATYSEPTSERTPNVPINYSKSPELPDWMKEEVTPVPETIESIKAKKVSDPRVTKAKKNYENTKTPVTSPYENTKFEPESIVGKRPASSPAYPDFEATGEAIEQPAASAQTLPVQPLATATGVIASKTPEALQPAVQKPVMPNMPSNDPNVIYDFEYQPVVKKGTEVPNSEISDPLESYKAQEQINSEIRARNALNKDQDLVRHLKDQGITKEQFQAMTPENRSALAKDIKHKETTYYPPEHLTKSGKIMNLKGRSKYTGFNEGRLNQFLDLWKD